MAETLSTVCLTWLITPQPSAPAPRTVARVAVRILLPARFMGTMCGPPPRVATNCQQGDPFTLHLVGWAALPFASNPIRIEPPGSRYVFQGWERRVSVPFPA